MTTPNKDLAAAVERCAVKIHPYDNANQIIAIISRELAPVFDGMGQNCRHPKNSVHFLPDGHEYCTECGALFRAGPGAEWELPKRLRREGE